jgi:hypothetical protein
MHENEHPWPVSYSTIVLPAPQRFGNSSLGLEWTPGTQNPDVVDRRSSASPSLSYRVQDAVTAVLAKPYGIPLAIGVFAAAFLAVDRMVSKRDRDQERRRRRVEERRRRAEATTMRYPTMNRAVARITKMGMAVGGGGGTQRGYYGNPARERPERIEYGDRWEVVS